MAGFWRALASLAGSGPSTEPGSSGVWSLLLTKLDARSQRLLPIADCVEVRLPASDGRQKVVLKNPARGTYVSLSPDEAELFHTLDGKLTLEEACNKLLQEKNIFPYFMVGSCLGKLYVNGFLQGTSPPVFPLLKKELSARTWRVRLFRWFNREIGLRHLNGAFESILNQALTEWGAHDAFFDARSRYVLQHISLTADATLSEAANPWAGGPPRHRHPAGPNRASE